MENSSGGSSDYSNSRIVVTNEKKPVQGIKIENPFTFKVLQVFTGFGFGCGIGIGQGMPINMGTLPVALFSSLKVPFFILAYCMMAFFGGLFKPKNVEETHEKSILKTPCKLSFYVSFFLFFSFVSKCVIFVWLIGKCGNEEKFCVWLFWLSGKKHLYWVFLLINVTAFCLQYLYQWFVFVAWCSMFQLR